MRPTGTEAEAIHKAMVRDTDRATDKIGSSRDTADPIVSREDIPRATVPADMADGGAVLAPSAVLVDSEVLIPVQENPRDGGMMIFQLG